MITNIIAAVAVHLTTNCTEIFPQQQVPGRNDGPPGNLMYVTELVPVPNPKEKWVKTEIKEVTIWTFGNGIPPSTQERSITNWTQHYNLAPPQPPVWTIDASNTPPPLFWPHAFGHGINNVTLP